MRILVFASVVLVIIAAGYGYVGWRLIKGSALRNRTKRLSLILLGVLFALPVGMFILQISGEWGPSSTGLVWPAYVALGLVSFVVTLLVLRDAIWVLISGTKAVGKILRPSKRASAFAPDRRMFLIRASNVGIVGGAAVITGYGMGQALKTPPVVTVEVPIAGLHPDLEGFTILQITDIHAGLTVGRAFVEAVVAQANTQTPDLVVMTGDLVDGSVPSLRSDVEPMGSLGSVYGRYFVTGNHEYYSGVEPWVEEVRRIGFSVLLNEHVLIRRGEGSMILAGVTDPVGGDYLPAHATSVARALEGAPDDDVRILLAHQPKSIFEAASLGIDLQLSGHTHGGQFVPWNFFASIAQPYISGLHRHENTWIYVSKGAGYWGAPVRVGARSEISLIRLVTQKDGGRASGRA